MRRHLGSPFLFAVMLPSLAGVQVAPAQLPGQPAHELILFLQNGNFSGAPWSADRTASVHYYHAVSMDLKLFGELGLQRRFDLSDESAGGGLYYAFDETNMLYSSISFGFGPTVIPVVDATAEYSRKILGTVVGGLGYRAMAFRDETVHMLLPCITVYSVPRWIILSRAYLGMLERTPGIRGAFLLQAFYEWSEGFMPILMYAVGSEAYRAGSLSSIRSLNSWSAGVGCKVSLHESFRLRLEYQYMKRTGEFQQHTITLATAFLW